MCFRAGGHSRTSGTGGTGIFSAPAGLRDSTTFVPMVLIVLPVLPRLCAIGHLRARQRGEAAVGAFFSNKPQGEVVGDNLTPRS